MDIKFKKALTASALFLSLASIATPSFSEELSTLERIKQTKVMKLGVVQGDPWYFKNPVTGKWDGVGYRLGVKIAEDLGATVTPVETTYGNAPAAIQSKQADLVLVLDATDERKQAISFPDEPLLYYKQGILLRDDIHITKWQELNSPEYRIGTAMGSSVDRDLTERLPNAKIERYANTDETVAAFMSGRIDGLAFFHPALAIAKSKIHMGNLIIPKPEISNPTSGGIRKEDVAFRKYVNNEFAKLMKDGTTQSTFESYLKVKGLDPKEIPGILK
jgi:polar amino acid transport system substrate-binding protein